MRYIIIFALFLLSFKPIKMGSPQAIGLIGSWAMNEGGGQKAFDGTGYGQNNGTLTNGAVFKVAQKGQCISFDGSNDYIDCGTTTRVNPGTLDFSISLWIGTADANQACAVIQKRSAATFPLYSININANTLTGATGKKIGAVFYDLGGVAVRALTTTNNIIDGKWHHILVTWVLSGNVIKIYIDGIDQALTTDASSGTVTGVSPDLSLKIGTNTGSGFNFLGNMQNVLMYNRALTPTEVWDLYVNPNKLYIK